MGTRRRKVPGGGRRKGRRDKGPREGGGEMCIRDRNEGVIAPFKSGNYYPQVLRAVAPVSYTHLDVYKRQLRPTRRCSRAGRYGWCPGPSPLRRRSCLLYTSRCV